jgi:hypothetical protein
MAATSIESGRRLAASLYSAGSLRGACPGPFLGGLTYGATLATGSLPVSALGTRTVTLRLHAGRSLSDDGYTIRTSGTLTVTLRRGAITQRILEQPSPFQTLRG